MQIAPVVNHAAIALRQTTQVSPAGRSASAPEGRPGSQVTGGAAHVEEVRSRQAGYRFESPATPSSRTAQDETKEGQAPVYTAKGEEPDPQRHQGVAPRAPNGESLSVEQLAHLEQLKVTDRAVRQHEMAHQIAGGAYSGGASYEYEVGPDGKRYAVAGEVSIDCGPIKGDPQATIAKMEKVIAAALAPADPSTQDRKVAAMARQALLSARLELAQLQSEMSAARGQHDTPTQVVETIFMPGQIASQTLNGAA
ncbi:putative metalloprotease CJM1_0395 family protein [Litchfieldella xinjiangensis]|uniref:putative metalloprotease CJM1_0395 family protein n=1 Tax=Litchfieldella xinjiangensis TaxID=1166948 RepID=UPI0009DEA536|nr:putative metalloprotease CJM1_0395 family protein [Halomonas xinjiangensis]